MIARLVPLNGGLLIDLSPVLNLIGRHSSCDVKVLHKSVSNHHCIMCLKDGVILVRDLNSSNGTRVNGRLINNTVLRAGDEVAIASLKYRVTVIHGEAVDYSGMETSHVMNSSHSGAGAAISGASGAETFPIEEDSDLFVID